MEQDHFSKAPITEALIDLRITPAEGVTAADIARLSSATAERYTPKQELHTGEVSWDIGDGPTANVVRQHVGSRYVSEDGREILQARLEGFTFSVLRPYERWETFITEARRLWDAYRQIVLPLAITRVGVRYINRLDISQASIEPRDYLRTFPEISSDAPDGIINYFMQLLLEVPEMKGVAVINQTIVPPPKPGMVSVVLDIDLSRDASREEEVPQSEEDIWNLLEQMRVHKNAIFKACITERTKELIR